MEFSIWATIAASLTSGLLGALLSIIVYSRRERRRFKVDTLKRFAANRYDLKGDEFSRALNEVFVVFNENAHVMKELQAFHERVSAKEPAEDALVRLYKAMCDDVGINYDGFNDSFFLTPFNTKASSQVPSRTEIQP